jgi:hypothetical protein
MWAVSWPAWTRTTSASSLPSCGMPPVAAGRHVIPQKTPQGSGSLRLQRPAQASGCSPYRSESCKPAVPTGTGLSESTGERRARHLQCRRLGTDNTWIAF